MASLHFHIYLCLPCAFFFLLIHSLQMNPKTFFILKTFLLFTILANQALSEYPKYEACAPKSCGQGPNISYPFWLLGDQESYCGYPNFEITCSNDNPILKISNDGYIIKNIFHTNHSLHVASASVEHDTCPTPLHNVSLDRTPFNIISGYVNFSFLYNCSSKPPDYVYLMSCASNSSSYSFASFHVEALEYANYPVESCHHFLNAPVYTGGSDVGSLIRKNYTEILNMGFLLNWTAPNCSTCQTSGGRCGFENNEFVCLCYDGPEKNSCYDGKFNNVKLKVIIAHHPTTSLFNNAIFKYDTFKSEISKC